MGYKKKNHLTMGDILQGKEKIIRFGWKFGFEKKNLSFSVIWIP